MTLQDITLSLFTICSSIRIFGYLPQLLRTARDTSGGASTSVTTWIVFLAANASVVAYAIVNVKDVVMATVFGVNVLCCALIAFSTLWKRHRFAATRSPLPERTIVSPAALPMSLLNGAARANG